MCRDRSHDRPGQGRAPRRVPKRAARPCVRVVCLHASPLSPSCTRRFSRTPGSPHGVYAHVRVPRNRGVVEENGGKKVY